MQTGVHLDYLDRSAVGYALGEWVCTYMPERTWSRYTGVELSSKLDGLKIHMDEQNPYASLIYVFYTVNTLRYELHVIGWLTFDEVYDLHGIIMPKEHLEMREEFDSIFSPPPPPPLEEEEEDDNYFWIPVNGLPRDADCPLYTSPYQQIPGFIEERSKWYISGGKEKLPVPFRSAEWNPLMELDACLGTLLIGDAIEHMYSLPGTILDMTKQHEYWTMMRTELECRRLRELFSHFKTEKRIIHLLEKNWLKGAMCDGEMLRMIPVSDQDRMFFYRRNKTMPPPTVVWTCPMEKIPSTRALKLPIYPPRGEVHLTYIDIFPWACQMMMNEARAFCTENIDREYSDELLKIARMVSHEYTLTKPVQMMKSVRFDDDDRKRARSPSKQQQQQQEVLSNDSKLLLDVAPPCVKEIMLRYEFPKHGTRRYLVYMWRKAGFSMDSIGTWFQEKHDAYPGDHTGAKTVRERFDYIYAFNQIESNGPGCAKIISQTISNSAGGLGFTCPYVAGLKIQDIEELSNACRCKCQRPGETRLHRDPAWLMGGRLWRITHGYSQKHTKTSSDDT